jgi:hypothetical protein
MTAEDYLWRVGSELRDLPWSTRHDLVAELRGHLDELPPDTDLVACLGEPERYAADLRSAARLERHRGVLAFLRARRPRNLILAALALTVIGLAIGAVVWINSYQPMTVGNFYRLPAGSVEPPALDTASVVFHQGRPFTLGVNLLNNGRFTVHVLGVPYLAPNPWTARLLMSTPGKYTGGAGRPLTPFRPLDLKPGDSVFLQLKGVYACHGGMAPGGAITYSEFPVRYRFLWRVTTTDIALPENLAFVFPKGCPPAKNTTIRP